MVEANLSSVFGMQSSSLMNMNFDNKSNNEYNNMVFMLGKAYLAGFNAQAGYTPNLDNNIPQIYPTDTLLMGGESSMAKQRKERIEIGRDINGKPKYAFATGTSPQALHESIARIMFVNGLMGFSYTPAQARSLPVGERSVIKYLL